MIEDLKDPEEDINRVKKDEWLVLGWCLHSSRLCASWSKVNR